MTRRSCLVLLSIVAHACALVFIVVASVMATGDLPVPFDRIVFNMPHAVKLADIRLTAPPVGTGPRAQPPAQRADAAPVVAPSSIAPEPATLPRGPDVMNIPFDAAVLSGAFASAMPPPPPPAPPAAPAAANSAPLRVSSGIQQPRKVFNVDPVYPAAARAAHMQGLVILETVIDTEGRVESARVLKSVPLLDQAALDAVRQWRFTPTLLNGSAVSIVMTITVNFTLDR